MQNPVCIQGRKVNKNPEREKVILRTLLGLQFSEAHIPTAATLLTSQALAGTITSSGTGPITPLFSLGPPAAQVRTASFPADRDLHPEVTGLHRGSFSRSPRTKQRIDDNPFALILPHLPDKRSSATALVRPSKSKTRDRPRGQRRHPTRPRLQEQGKSPPTFPCPASRLHRSPRQT